VAYYLWLSNWQDWGLRCARKTAFHAAVQYYCRLLGIVCYDAPLPIVWADPETNTYMPSPPPFEGDEGALLGVDMMNRDAAPSPITAGGGGGVGQLGETVDQMKPTLGFLPPLAVRSAYMRARKSKGKKSIMRATGADG
jgi:hypothetical protein